jgi:hypothetical protein
LENCSTESTVKTATVPSALVISALSPGLTIRSSRKTAGPVLVSTCPATIAGPRSPGVGPSAYQPTRLVSAAGGALRLPAASRCSGVNGASTSMPFIVSRTGLDGGSGGTVIIGAGGAPADALGAVAAGAAAEAGGAGRPLPEESTEL